jgi:hypothetical protein
LIVGRRKKRIMNNMDEAEVGPFVQLCSKCNTLGHSYKKCTTSYYSNTSNNDVAAPSTSGSGRGHGCGRGRRTSHYNQGMQ